jgi:hypothetical protein
MDVMEKYNFFHPDFWKELSGPDRFLIDISALAESNRREREAQEKAQRKAKDSREHPGMERYSDNSEFWTEVNKANQETKK